MRGETTMIYLKIESSQASYIDENGNICPITNIDKKGLLNLINKALDESVTFEMDDPEKSNIPNEAQKIIYENIYNKINDLISNRDTIISEISNLYKEEYSKYSIDGDDYEK
jgi:hypothetical protein